jgi:hypothetical protein
MDLSGNYITSIKSNYPYMMQSEYDNAPFNEQDPPKKEVCVCCSQSLSREDNILAEYNDFDEEYIQLENDYTYEHETPLSLINKFKKCLQSGKLPENFNYWIAECSGWNEDETEIVES